MGSMMLVSVTVAVIIGIIVGKKAVDPHSHQEFEQVAKFAEDVGKDIDGLTKEVVLIATSTKSLAEDYGAFKDSSTQSFTSFEETLDMLQDVAGTLQHGFESVASKVDENEKRVEAVAVIVHDKVLGAISNLTNIPDPAVVADLSARLANAEVEIQSVNANCSEMALNIKALAAQMKKGKTKVELSAVEEAAPAES